MLERPSRVTKRPGRYVDNDPSPPRRPRSRRHSEFGTKAAVHTGAEIANLQELPQHTTAPETSRPRVKLFLRKRNSDLATDTNLPDYTSTPSTTREATPGDAARLDEFLTQLTAGLAEQHARAGLPPRPDPLQREIEKIDAEVKALNSAVARQDLSPPTTESHEISPGMETRQTHDFSCGS